MATHYNKWQYGRKVQSPMPCIALWFIVFAMHHGLFVSRVSWAKEAIFVLVHVAVVLPWLFFHFLIMGKCFFNRKWKGDEKFKAWIAADPTSKTKAMCVVCKKAIVISSMGEAALQSHIIGKKHKKLMELKLSSPSVTHFLSSSSENLR